MRLAFILIVWVVSFVPQASSADRWQVWGNGYLPPMAYIEKGFAKGFGLEITKAVLDEAGIDYEIRMALWQRAYKEAKDGNGMVFGMFWTNSRAKIFEYSSPLWEEKIVLVTRKGSEFPFTKIGDLKGKTIGMQRGTRPGSEFERALAAQVFIAEPDNDPISRLHRLHKKRVDAAVFNPGIAAVVWNAHRAGLPPEDFSVLGNPLAVKAKHIGIVKFLKPENTLERINSAIAKLKSDGALVRINRRYESATPQ